MALILLGLFMMFFCAIMGEPPEKCLLWLGLCWGGEILVEIIGGIKRKGSSGSRVSVTDKMLFDKGVTYGNGYEYERYVAYWLERKGYRNVLITQPTGDYGADILCTDRDGKKIAVQCKYYGKPVGYKAVEEALGGMHYYGCDMAYVVTNNTYTKQALDAAKKTGVKLYERVK